MKSFTNLIQQIIETETATFDVLVLKGFNNDTLRQIEKTMPHPSGKLPLDANNWLDLPLIQKSFPTLLKAIKQSPQGHPLMLDFESFIQMASNADLNEIGKRFLIVENNLMSEYPNQSNCRAVDFEDTIHADKEIPDDSPFHKFYSNATHHNQLIYVQYIDGFEDEFENIRKINLFNETEPSFEPLPSTKADNSIDFIFQAFSSEYLDLKTAIYNGKDMEAIKVSAEDSIKKQKSVYNEIRLLASVLQSLEIEASYSLFGSSLGTEFRPALSDLLSQYWSSKAFRSLYFYTAPDTGNQLTELSQAVIIEEVIHQYENGRQKKQLRDIMLTAPTGAGKSLLFQLPAMYLAEQYKAVTIVISPLIALMKDQVIALKTLRNYHKAACINSELSVIEREEVLQKVYEGEISLLYLSPELLLSQELSVFLGARELGLLVIDEAHLVTTWGRDFRTDYWYLGNFIRKARRYFNYKFPVLAVTATAVYGGPNDMVFETLDSLYLENPRIFIGKIKRDDIEFDIKEAVIERFHAKEKFTLTAARITELIDAGQKTIVYCPWVSHLIPVRDALQPNYREKTGLYFGGLNKTLKNETYEHFKSNQISTIISTKAFGMGVDIDDITRIYHHAPSGHLADYVQEIGRAARRSDLKGVAMTDFNLQDLKFTKILYAFSGIKQFQLQLVLDKILKIYKVKNNQNLLVSVNDFQYIFKEEDVDVEQKVKSSLILLEKDLQSKYHYNVIIARPRNLFTAVYARINEADVKKFTSKYGKSSRYIPHPLIEAKGQKVFSLNLDKIWKTHFSDQNFPQLKKAYFDKLLFQQDELYVSPQIRIVYNFNFNAKETYELLAKNFDIVAKALNETQPDFFTEEMFAQTLEGKYDNKITARRIAELILSIYSSAIDPKRKKDFFVTPECFIQQKKSDHEFLYKPFAGEYLSVRTLLKKRYDRMFGEMKLDERSSQYFIPANDDKNIGMIHLAYLLEAFNLGTFVIGGGEKPGMFIRINDPVKLNRLAKKVYTNDILKEIDRRQKTSLNIMEYFFTHQMDTSQRWEFIEKYFLGTPAKELIGYEVTENS